LVGFVLSSWGARVLPFRATLDGARTLVATMTIALRHSDAVVLVGGTESEQRNSAAAAIDLLQPGGVVIEGVRMMPSAGLVLGAVGNCPVLGVPGDPTAALSGLLAVGEPIVRRLVGRTEKSLARQYTLERAIRGKRGWDCFIAVRTGNGACSPIETSSSYIS